MLSLTAVSTQARRDTASGLSSVDLFVAPGEVVFLRGTGKSTIIDLICGSLVPDDGEVTLLGQPLQRLTERSACLLRQRIGLVTQSPLLLADRSALENVALPLIVNGTARHEIRILAAAALAEVGLAYEVDALVAELSASEKQRVAIARAIVTDPELLIADEPLSAIGDGGAEELSKLCERRQKANQATLLASNSPVLARLAVLSGWRMVDLDEWAQTAQDELPQEEEISLEELSPPPSPDDYEEITFEDSDATVVPFPSRAATGNGDA